MNNGEIQYAMVLFCEANGNVASLLVKTIVYMLS